jgi:hypothetical protein
MLIRNAQAQAWHGGLSLEDCKLEISQGKGSGESVSKTK